MAAASSSWSESGRRDATSNALFKAFVIRLNLQRNGTSLRPSWVTPTARVYAERSRSPAGASNASPGPVDCEVRPTAATVGCEFLSHHLPDDVEGGAPVDVLSEGFVYQGLVVAAPCPVYHPTKVIEDCVV